MNVEQMSVADLLREGKQAMALALGVVGPETRARWAAVTAEIDLRLSMGDIDEGDLEGRVQAAIKAAVDAAQMAVADKNAALKELAKVIAERDRAYQRLKNNATNLQFMQDAFNKNHHALVGEWGSDLSRGAMLLWAWAQTVLPTGDICLEEEMEEEMEEEKVNRGRWTVEDKIKLLMLVKPGFTLAGAAAEMARTVGGIKYQLGKLGLTTPVRMTNGAVFGDVAWRGKWFGSRIDPEVREALVEGLIGRLVENNNWKRAEHGYLLPLNGIIK